MYLFNKYLLSTAIAGARGMDLVQNFKKFIIFWRRWMLSNKNG